MCTVIILTTVPHSVILSLETCLTATWKKTHTQKTLHVTHTDTRTHATLFQRWLRPCAAASKTKQNRSLTGKPSEMRLPAYTVPNPPLPSTGPTWYTWLNCSFPTLAEVNKHDWCKIKNMYVSDNKMAPNLRSITHTFTHTHVHV